MAAALVLCLPLTSTLCAWPLAQMKLVHMCLDKWIEDQEEGISGGGGAQLRRGSAQPCRRGELRNCGKGEEEVLEEEGCKEDEEVRGDEEEEEESGHVSHGDKGSSEGQEIGVSQYVIGSEGREQAVRNRAKVAKRLKSVIDKAKVIRHSERSLCWSLGLFLPTQSSPPCLFSPIFASPASSLPRIWPTPAPRPSSAPTLRPSDTRRRR